MHVRSAAGDAAIPPASADAPPVDLSDKVPDTPSAKSDMPSGGDAARSAAGTAAAEGGGGRKVTGDVPCVDLADRVPDTPPPVEGDVPSADASVTAPGVSVGLPSASGDVSLLSAPVDVPSGEVEACITAMGVLSADIGGQVDGIAAEDREVPSAEEKNPPTKDKIEVRT